ncbi:VanW family protein [Candidatus Darwinibacter acetoxidans]
MILTGPRGEAVSFTLRELGIMIDSKATFMEAYQQGRNHRPPRSYLDRLALLKKKAFIPLRCRLDENRLRQALLPLAETFNRPPQDAYFQAGADDREALLVPEEPGYRVLQEEFYKQLLYTLEVPGLPLQMPVPYEDIPARLTALAFKQMGISALRSSFTTRFDLSKKDRVHNIKLAASTLDGCIVAPGELFSLNHIVGDTTPEKGYREAPVIVGEELLPGYGGGLCQISSTLYNAALLANLEIVERHNHNLTVPYLPPGRDATIAYGARDLKFRNSSGQHILINAGVKNDALTFWIFGAPMAERVEISTVELEVFPPPVRYRVDPALSPGTEEKDEGSPGYVVEVWKTLYRGDRVISREKISVDRYSPYPTVIRRGAP